MAWWRAQIAKANFIESQPFGLRLGIARRGMSRDENQYVTVRKAVPYRSLIPLSSQSALCVYAKKNKQQTKEREKLDLICFSASQKALESRVLKPSDCEMLAIRYQTLTLSRSSGKVSGEFSFSFSANGKSESNSHHRFITKTTRTRLSN